MSHRRGTYSAKVSLPQWFQDLRTDYNAAKTSRYRRNRTGVGGTGKHADWHYRSESDYLRLMELARDIDRNDIVIPQGVTRCVDNILQEGFQLDPKTGDKEIDAILFKKWHVWSEDPELCDKSAESDFHEIEKFVLRHVIIDGDVVVLGLKDDESLQLIEAHRIRTPSNTKQNVVHGVLLDEYRKRLEYWITKEDLNPNLALSRVSDVKRFPVRDPESDHRQLFHVYNPKRVSQTRGVTVLSPVVDAIGMHDDTQFANLVRLQISSCITFMRMREASFDGGANQQIGEREEEALADGSTRVIEGVAPGLELIGEPGEKIEGFSPNIPGAEYLPFATMILNLISVNLGMPLQLFLLDAKQTNFSGWRGAMDQARIGFKQIQRWLVSKFHRNVYQWKLRQWIQTDKEISKAYQVLGDDIFKHRWTPPAWSYIEPLKDAKADDFRVTTHQISPRRLQSERGRDWDEITSEIVEDNSLLITKAMDAAKQLNDLYPDDSSIDWKQILNPRITSDSSKEEDGEEIGNDSNKNGNE